MKKTLAIILILFSTNLFSQQKAILLVVPETDTAIAYTSHYRLSGSVEPGSAATINGEELYIYGSGAFCGLLNITEDENRFVIESTLDGEIQTKEFWVNKFKSNLTTTDEDSLILENVKMLPDKDYMLMEGEKLKLRVKGTPGNRVFVFDSFELKELPKSRTKGIGGIYEGEYIVGPGDTIENKQIEYKMFGKNGKSISKINTNLVTMYPAKYPLRAKSIGIKPYLNYGLGTNRLGGAKLGYIDDGVKLLIDGKVGEQYRVRLTDNQTAWIPEEFIELLPGENPDKSILSSTITITSDENYEYVSIYLGERLPYSTIVQVEPTLIKFNIYGVTSNTNWIVHKENLTEVNSVDYEQIEKDLLQLKIRMKRKQLWGYSAYYKGNVLIFRITKRPKDLEIEKLNFVLDAGHGGTNNGALGSTGLLEKDVNFSIVTKLKALLEDEGAGVILTREKDTSIFNSARLNMLDSVKCDLLISVHSNSIGLTTNPANTEGTAAFYKHIFNKPLADAVFARMLETGLKPYGVVGKFNFTLNAPTAFPNILVETAFMSNPEDEMKLMSDDFRMKIAEKIFDGIEDFLDYTEDN